MVAILNALPLAFNKSGIDGRTISTQMALA